MDDDVIDFNFDRLSEFLSGCISLCWLTIRLLEEHQAIPEGSALPFFQQALDQLDPNLRASGIGITISLLIDHLKSDRLSKPLPIVIPRGKQ